MEISFRLSFENETNAVSKFSKPPNGEWQWISGRMQNQGFSAEIGLLEGG